ncbi:RNA polymerase sigma factor [Paenibacillus koleovorans]|uniref:RNA polymerase sigma factor n=1 Tax=Paenibacillus koleovorans TaxID=121608 RepID=UPI000FD90CA4|nr:RNA polymerase sigma factor [Paenibacillus koleovorans]
MWTQTVELDAVSQEEQDVMLQELYRQMFVVAYSITRSRSEAMDVVQESWLKILMKLHTLKDRDKLIQWAKVIASNTAYNMMKRSSKLTALVREEQGLYEYNGTGVEDKVVQRMICATIERLDQTTRRIFVYKYYQDLKDQEIATRMGMPVGTIKARLHRGKEQLRQYLDEPPG